MIKLHNDLLKLSNFLQIMEDASILQKFKKIRYITVLTQCFDKSATTILIKAMGEVSSTKLQEVRTLHQDMFNWKRYETILTVWLWIATH